MHHIIAIDIDGCLAEKSFAMDLSKVTPDWSLYFFLCINAVADAVLPALVRELSREGYTIYIVTNRPEIVRWQTKTWLKHHNIPFQKLIMNQGQFDRTDLDFKKSLFKTGDLSPSSLVAFFDDNQEVVEALREMGVSAHRHQALKL